MVRDKSIGGLIFLAKVSRNTAVWTWAEQQKWVPHKYADCPCGVSVSDWIAAGPGGPLGTPTKRVVLQDHPFLFMGLCDARRACQAEPVRRRPILHRTEHPRMM
jgi:hypothetical protein